MTDREGPGHPALGPIPKSRAWDALLPPGDFISLPVVANVIAAAHGRNPLTSYRSLCEAVAASPPRVAHQRIAGEIKNPRAEALRLCVPAQAELPGRGEPTP